MSDFSVVTCLPFVAFIALFCLQSVFPRRAHVENGRVRATHNLLLWMVNTLLMRLFVPLIVPLTLINVAGWAEQQNIGLFNCGSVTSSPVWLTVMVCVLLLDLAIYWQHVATHKLDCLWRLHKVHHADHAMDVTTAVRFHPIELLLSLAYKSIAVAILGAPVSAVIIFELLLFIGPAFNHSNLALPGKLDAMLRWVIVTPDVHRAHHSTLIEEQNTNYGFFIVWWDKWFSTYTPEPAGGHLDMSIGLESADEHCVRVDHMLAAPFRRVKL